MSTHSSSDLIDRQGAKTSPMKMTASGLRREAKNQLRLRVKSRSFWRMAPRVEYLDGGRCRTWGSAMRRTCAGLSLGT